MAKIPLMGVPQAPGTVKPLLTQLPTPNVTYAEGAQTLRGVDYGQIRVPEVSAQMKATTDFEKHIGGLQQREMNAPYDDLFRANTAIGQSLMSVGNEIAISRAPV